MNTSRFHPRCCWLAGVFAVAWLVTACAVPPPPGGEGPAEQSDTVMLEYRRSGGIAGWNDHLVIYTDGQATLERKGGQSETFTLDQETLDTLRKLMTDNRFFELKSSYLPQRTIPDAFHYVVTYRDGNRRHTVETSDGAVPPELAPIISQLNRIIDQR